MNEITQVQETLQPFFPLPNLNIQLEVMPRLSAKDWFLFCAVYAEVHNGPKQLPYAYFAEKLKCSVDKIQQGMARIEATLALTVTRIKISWNRNAPNFYSLGELVIGLLNRRKIAAEKIKTDKGIESSPLARRIYDGARRVMKAKDTKISQLMKEIHELKAAKRRGIGESPSFNAPCFVSSDKPDAFTIAYRKANNLNWMEESLDGS